MFNFALAGLSHRTARLDLRQTAAFNAEQMKHGLKHLAAQPSIQEAMIVSTCNRVEVICCVESDSDGFAEIESFLSGHSGVPLPELQPALYRYTGQQVVQHVFRVASSLDSMVLGEPQILGQMKACYKAAVDASTVGGGLNGLLQAAFRTAKRVRSETSIGEYPVSVSSAAVELLRKIFGELERKSILIVGAGKMGEAAIRHLAEAGSRAVYVANRSPQAAKELAVRFNGIAVPFTSLTEWISRVDIVITSTGAEEVLIDRAMVQRIMHERRNAPIAFVDISVPRNVDPAVGAIDNVFCYDVDDLAAVVEANLQERTRAAAAAEKVVLQEVEAFCKKMNSAEVGPVVMQIQDRIEEICRTELRRALNKIGPQESKHVQELETMISRIAGKIAHPLVTQIRNSPDSGHRSAYMDLIERIFKTTDSRGVK